MGMIWIIALSAPVFSEADNGLNTIEPNAIVMDLKTKQALSVEDLITQMQAQDIILLGELHDSPKHHEARAQLIQRLPCSECVVVSEHLPANQQVTFTPKLLGSLEAAGFDAKGWDWPIHEPLFKSIQSKQLKLVGGNISHALSSEIFKQGEKAIPDPLLHTYQQSPLSDEARVKLDQDLKDGHCGQLSDTYLPLMRLIQRIKDASFAQFLLQHQPALLIAGNGHVRKDYGVPQILRAEAPHLKVLSVGFIEQDDWTSEAQQALSEMYDVVWVSQNTPRSDPCKDFSAPHLKQ